MEIPFYNDLRQTTPLNIVTNGGWQYLSSPLEEWIDGTPANFTLTRDETSISGFYIISLGPNSAPVLSMAEDYALPWDNTSYDFDVIIDDKLKPWLLEINYTPSFTTDTPLDKVIKEGVIEEAIKIMNIHPK